VNITIAKLTNPSAFPDAYIPYVDPTIVDVVDTDLGVCIQRVGTAHSVVVLSEDTATHVVDAASRADARRLAHEHAAREHAARARRL